MTFNCLLQALEVTKLYNCITEFVLNAEVSDSKGRFYNAIIDEGLRILAVVNYSELQKLRTDSSNIIIFGHSRLTCKIKI